MPSRTTRVQTRYAENPGRGRVTVHVVIVHHRTPDRLRGCISALHQQAPPPSRIVVVDTGVSAGATAPREAQGAEWLSSGGNIGYAAAVNRGAQDADAGALLILNADVELRPGALAALVARLESDPSASIVAPRTHDNAGALEYNARSFPTAATGVLGRSSWLTMKMRLWGRTPRGLRSSEAPFARSVDWVAGSCMLVRRATWEQLGGFDECYWMYWEDADFCRRAKLAGQETWLEPAAMCAHATGSSGRSVRTVLAFHESAAQYYARHVAQGKVDAGIARMVLRLRGGLLARRLGRAR